MRLCCASRMHVDGCFLTVMPWAAYIIIPHRTDAQASGFCYVNDIVLACLELLKYHQRVCPHPGKGSPADAGLKPHLGLLPTACPAAHPAYAQ